MCVLCDNWDSTPYSKRPTTDISTNTGHELMLLGFYLGAMTVKGVVDTSQAELPSLCPEHEQIMQSIADFKEKQAAMLAAQVAMGPPQDAISVQQGYKDRIAKLNAPPPPPPKPIPQRFTAQAMIAGVTTEPQTGPVIQPIPPAPGVDPAFKFECPNCKKMVTNGEIHDCVFQP